MSRGPNMNQAVPVDDIWRDMGDDLHHVQAKPIPVDFKASDGRVVRVGISFGDYSSDARHQGPYVRLELLSKKYGIVDFRFCERGADFVQTEPTSHVVYHNVDGCPQEACGPYIKYLFLKKGSTLRQVLEALERIKFSVEVIE